MLIKKTAKVPANKDEIMESIKDFLTPMHVVLLYRSLGKRCDFEYFADTYMRCVIGNAMEGATPIKAHMKALATVSVLP